MPYRLGSVVGVLAGLAGLTLLAVVLLRDGDARRAARTGPRWRRRLIGAALVLLAAIGISVVGRGCIFTCYVPSRESMMGQDDFQRCLARLDGRLALLEKYAAAEAIDAAVVRQVPLNAEEEVYLLETEEAHRRLSPASRGRAGDLCKRARVSLERLRMRVGWDGDAMHYFEWNARLSREHYDRRDGQPPQTAPAPRER
jgi:hypothetical protein